jgi:Ca2+-binding RTX toxin-like protein
LSEKQTARAVIGALAAMLAALALTPAVAAASSVAVEGGVLVLRATPGEQNRVTVGPDDSDDLVQIGDAERPSFPAGVCAPAAWYPDAVVCTPQPGGIRVETGDGDDQVDVTAALPGAPALTVLVGDGNDEVSAWNHSGPAHFEGGAGNDKLDGGRGRDVLLGGPGNDELDGREEGDELRGGEGDDSLRGDAGGAPGADTIDGGPGRDRADGGWEPSLMEVQPFVTVSLDGQPNDGRPGEGDNVIGIERIHLNYPAALTAAGDPVDFEVFNASVGPSRLTGSPGPDRLRSYDAADTIAAGAGDDWVEAGYGDDTIDAGPGRDTINADAGSGACNFLVCRLPHGNDTIEARDGQADSIECGPGTDVARVDAIDTVSNCETVQVAKGGGAGGRGCVVPKIRRGSGYPAARRKLRRASCAIKVIRIRSGVRRGRVVKLSPRAGKRVKAGGKVKVYLSRGKARRATASVTPVARVSEVDVVSPPPPILNAVKVRCVKLLRGGRVCGKRFKDDWKRGWWSDPARFEIVEAAFYGDTEMRIPSDEDKSFFGEGYSTIKAVKSFRGTFKLPRRKALVPAVPVTAKPTAWTMRSIGAWTTSDGTFGCNVDSYPSPPRSIAGVVSANPRNGTIGIQWTLWPAGFDCKGVGSPPDPDFPGLPSEAMSVRYKASAFRNAELIKLPVSIHWEGVRESDGARLKLDWSGRVVLRRVHHRL